MRVKRHQDLLPWLAISLSLAVWLITATLTVSSAGTSYLMLRSSAPNNREPVSIVINLFPHREPVKPHTDYKVMAVVDGFANPNKLQRLTEFVEDEEFTEILAPAYYGKSPMDGSRNYLPGSPARERHCSPKPPPAADRDYDFPLDQELCSYGPELVYNSFEDIYAAHLMHEVCLSFNIDSKKQVQRGLLVFDPQNSHKMRCVPCPNPVEFMQWGKSACGLMWNHQINARTLGDFSQCVEENAGFLEEIGQRQTPVGSDLVGGSMYKGAVLALAFAKGNPGHQSFDALLTLLPIIFPQREVTPFRVIVHQAPDCPDSEWICGLLRKIGFFEEHPLLPVNSTRMACFENLIIPKWGMPRESHVPKNYLMHLRQTLHDKFAFAPIPANRPKQLLLYAHETISLDTNAQRRIWKDMGQIAGHSEVQRLFPSIQFVQDFAAMTIHEQGLAFYEADLIVMPHGGQMGNIVFARKGSVVIEATCYPYSHFGMTGGEEGSLPGSMPRFLGIVHIVLVPCKCSEARNVDSNFRLGPSSVLKLYEDVKHNKPGTYIIGRMHSENEMVEGEIECFGSEQ